MKESRNAACLGRKPYVSPTMEVHLLLEEAHTICASGEKGGDYKNDPENPIDPGDSEVKEFDWFLEKDSLFGR